jgi:hypothetical protein
MPRLLGEAVELVDTTHSIVLLNPDPNGSAGPFQIFNYTVPAPSMGGSLFVPYTVSAKFGYTVKASWKGTVATGMRVQVQGLNSNTYYTWFNYQGTGTGDGDNGVVIGVSAAGAWMEAEAAVQPRTNASSQVRATSGIYPHTAAMRLVSVGEFAVDFTQLGFVFDQYITLGTVIVNMFDPNGVG